MTPTPRHLRLCHLIAAHKLEQEFPQKRTIPSAFTLLKAEFGFVGNRQQVHDAACDAACEGRFA